jgi:hypothetical protein
MSDYSENYLKIQRLLKKYHEATLKNQFENATRLAHDLADETIKLEISTLHQIKKQWIKR